MTGLLKPGALLPPGAAPVAPGQSPAVAPDESFGDLLENFISSVDGLGAESEAAKDAFLNGEPVDLHQVMILSEESGIAFDLLLELRNKLVEAYQKMISMPL